MSERAWHDVGAVDEVRGAGRVVLRVAGREIGVLVLAEGEGAARRAQPLPAPRRPALPRHACASGWWARRGPTPRAGGSVLACPWHGWEFDLETGRCPDDPRMRVATYPVRVDGRPRARAGVGRAQPPASGGRRSRHHADERGGARAPSSP